MSGVGDAAVVVLEGGTVTDHSPRAATLLDRTELDGCELAALLPDGVDRATLEREPATVAVEGRAEPLRLRLESGPDREWLFCTPIDEASAAAREAVVAAMDAPAYVTDAEGRVTDVNRAFEETLGYARERIVAEGAHFSTFTTADATRRVRETLGELSREGERGPRHLELTVVADDGRELPVAATVALAPGEGAFPGSVGVLREVSERRRREELLAVIDRALRHDLRTHVNAIDGYADAVAERTDGETTADYLERIGESATWLGKLGETLRTLQKAVDEGELSGTTVDPEHIVRSVAERYRKHHPRATVETHVTTDADLAAGGAVEYVLDNLVENAIVHNDGAEPSVDVWLADAPLDGWVDLHVEDDGPGLPATERAIVLGDAEITQLNHGSGVGLWVCRWIVDAFGGEISVEEESDGTVVTVRLRRAPTAE
jgi:PAS domain S-box-containing protein